MPEHAAILDEKLLRRQALEDAALALAEDMGDGDPSAAAALADQRSTARVICRQQAVLCGRPWFEAVFEQLDARMSFDWSCEEGAEMTPGAAVVQLQGATRALLSGERSALNFLQTLSGTATTTRRYAQKFEVLQAADSHAPSRTLLLDTRKTLPLLRIAQKYAVSVGGSLNHRLGLWDAVMLKENHITAAGSITLAVERIRSAHPDGVKSALPLIVEVEQLAQLEEAIAAGADQVLLDNFTPEQLAEAVALAQGRCRLEISGGVSEHSLAQLATLGADYISIGALTKNVQGVDFSLQLLL